MVSLANHIEIHLVALETQEQEKGDWQATTSYKCVGITLVDTSLGLPWN